MNASSRLLLSTFLLLTGLASLKAQTDGQKTGQPVELQLANGDRLTGELLWRADGKIRVRSAILGDLSLNESDVAILELPENNGEHRAATAPAAPSKPVPEPQAANAVSSAKSHDQAAATPRTPAWKGKIEMGLAQQSGRVESRNHQLRAEAERISPRDNLRATARMIYAEQNSRVSADRSETALRWRHQITSRAFSQTQTSYYRDDVSNIQFNGEQNIGLGYRFIDQPRHVLNMGSGVTAQYREWTAGRNGVAPYLDFFEDYTFKINDRISFVQDANLQYSPSDRAYSYGNNQKPVFSPDQDNFKMRLNASLHGKITDRLSANLRFEYEQDNAIKLSDASTLQRITSSLGYAF
jgi:putative salt-induced outer membrane protein YdiY